jgi:hypothetical protein
LFVGREVEVEVGLDEGLARDVEDGDLLIHVAGEVVELELDGQEGGVEECWLV